MHTFKLIKITLIKAFNNVFHVFIIVYAFCVSIRSDTIKKLNVRIRRPLNHKQVVKTKF